MKVALGLMSYPVRSNKAKKLMKEAGVVVKSRKKFKVTTDSWLYLAIVIDLYSRRVVGWSMGSRMTAKWVCDALKMVIWQRRPEAGVIVHSDRGSQYASKAYRRLIKACGFIGSMSRKGNCWDNAVAESFFGSLKQERVQWRHYQTRYEAQQDVMNYITMWYNSQRMHSFS